MQGLGFWDLRRVFGIQVLRLGIEGCGFGELGLIKVWGSGL